MPIAYALFVKIIVKMKEILCFFILFLLYGRDVLFVLDCLFERFNTLPESFPKLRQFSRPKDDQNDQYDKYQMHRLKNPFKHMLLLEGGNYTRPLFACQLKNRESVKVFFRHPIIRSAA